MFRQSVLSFLTIFVSAILASSFLTSCGISSENSNVQTVKMVQGNKCAFLIEGSRLRDDEATKFPEIKKAVALAKANDCSIFDAIHSYDTQNLAAVVALIPEDDLEVLVSHILVAFAGEASLSETLDKLIKRPMTEMVKQGALVKFPDWLKELKDSDIGDFLNSLLQNRFQGSVLVMKKALEKMGNLVLETSNKISAESARAYLIKNSDVTVVYGLIGVGHISFMDNISKVVKSDPVSRTLQFSQMGRTVQIHFFGGTHGTFAHFNALHKKIQNTFETAAIDKNSFEKKIQEQAREGFFAGDLVTASVNLELQHSGSKNVVTFIVKSGAEIKVDAVYNYEGQLAKRNAGCASDLVPCQSLRLTQGEAWKWFHPHEIGQLGLRRIVRAK